MKKTLIIAALLACGLSAKDKTKDAATAPLTLGTAVTEKSAVQPYQTKDTPTVFTPNREESLELDKLKLEVQVLNLEIKIEKAPIEAQINDYVERVKKAHPEFKDLTFDFQNFAWKTEAPKKEEPKSAPADKK